MIKNYLTIAWRSLTKNKVFSFINIFGLAVGLACCMLISAYIYQEVTYDTYPTKAKNIYRVGLHLTENGGVTDFALVDEAVGQGIKNNVAGVLASARISGRGSVYVKYNEKLFKEEHFSVADSNFLAMFSLPLIQGDDHNALIEPNSVVITSQVAKKYFGGEQAIGKTITLQGERDLKVTGVIDAIPANSHFHFDAFISKSTYPAKRETWSNISSYTYLLLNDGADPKKIEAQFPALTLKYAAPEIQHDMGVSLAEAQKSVNTFRFFLMPLTDIHLHSATKFEIEPNGDIQYVYIFSALAAFILLLACINFMNLSTANSVKRAKEVGIRKVLGSLKSSLVSQFLTESMVITAMAMAIGLALVYFALPYFNNLAGKQFQIDLFLSKTSIAAEILLVLFVGVLAGIYPAFFLSSFKVLSVLKGNTSAGPTKRNFLRSGLVVFQFFISTSLIIATLVVYRQLGYMQNIKLGYDKEQVLVINDAYALGNNIDAFKQQLLRDPRVTHATITGSVPGSSNMDGTQIYAKEFSDKQEHKEIHTNIYHVEDSYLTTLGIKMALGRNFSSTEPADSSAVVVNEALVRDLGWANTDPIGKTIVRSGQREFKVVGVVKDFHYKSAKEKIGPLMFIPGRSNMLMAVKVHSADVSGVLIDIKKQWDQYRATAPFSYSFLDEQYAALYGSEQRTGQIFTSFAIIAVIIASLGLFGLAAFSIRQRVKEIGIRKVLGASSGTITGMLSAEFLKLVGIAIVLSVPVTWYAMHKWLQDFAYRIDISWWVFALAGLIAIVVAFATVSFQSVKAALANPVKSLKNE
ncbi:ABC transporter permease [Mucilaginibacter psychrotolerans]|uniref:ABC transporter permease n=1 Tax=Mucilaginibacter psychrotolerans TaxID=1524096 RepID=A0A4Y8SMI6_9SPHI|nr:ABC transporter permease [Mucilaginibacter psychrotolerans]TFF39674.1 ABC transporter permease [Mucilaginibacter psychrotolerans]